MIFHWTLVGVFCAAFFWIQPLAAAATGDPTAVTTAPMAGWNPPVCLNQNVSYNADTSTGGDGTITKFEWDLDGDGVYETDTGLESSFSRAATALGSFNISVRVTNSLGRTAVSTPATVQVMECGGPEYWCAKEGAITPPPGPVGISVNGGAVYTNTPTVTLNMIWPTCTTTVLLANDGGFRPATTIKATETASWTLQTSGPERLPKTVYVRFGIWPNTSQTYSDDIILDQTAPVISSATTAGPATRLELPSGRTARSIVIRTKASDGTSGVSSMQVTANRKKPGSLMTYAARTRIRASAVTLWVRVRDGAGNYSAWTKVTHPGGTKAKPQRQS